MGLPQLAHFPIHHHSAIPEKSGEPVDEDAFQVLEYADGISVWQTGRCLEEAFDSVEDAIAYADSECTAYQKELP